MGKYKGISVEKEAIEVLKFFNMEYEKERNRFVAFKNTDMIYYSLIDRKFNFK